MNAKFISRCLLTATVACGTAAALASTHYWAAKKMRGLLITIL